MKTIQSLGAKVLGVSTILETSLSELKSERMSKAELAELRETAENESAQFQEATKSVIQLAAEIYSLKFFPGASESRTIQNKIEEHSDRINGLVEMVGMHDDQFESLMEIGKFKALTKIANEMAKQAEKLFNDFKNPKNVPDVKGYYNVRGFYNLVMLKAIEGKHINAEPLSREEVARRKEARTLHVVPWKGKLHNVPAFTKKAVSTLIQVFWAASKSIQEYEQKIRSHREARVKSSNILPDNITRADEGHCAFWFPWEDRRGGQERRFYLDLETDGDKITIKDATGPFVKFLYEEDEGTFPHERLPGMIFAATKCAGKKRNIASEKKEVMVTA